MSTAVTITMGGTAKPASVLAASTPSALGSTTLPQVALSYTWTIANASALAQKAKQDFTLKSPTFTVLLPLQTKETEWSLLVEKKSGENGTTVHLSKEENTNSTSKVLISDCTFSFPLSDCCLERETLRREEITLGQEQNCAKQAFRNTDIKNCLQEDDTLTIQVKANLLCITDPKETVDCVSPTPLDDIRSEMHSLYKDEVFTDATLKCKSKEFKVHRAVLASQSPVFKKMFEADMKEKKSRVVKIDFAPSVLSDLVTYLYTGTAPNVGKLARELLNAAKKYELPRLVAMCESELEEKIKVESVVDTLLLADRHSAVNLKRACLDFICLNSGDVYETSKWQDLKKNPQHHAALLFDVMEHRL